MKKYRLLLLGVNSILVFVIGIYGFVLINNSKIDLSIIAETFNNLVVNGDIDLSGGNIHDVTGVRQINPGGASLVIPGNVGIGTTDPGEKLTVNGNIDLYSGNDISGVDQLNPGGAAISIPGNLGVGLGIPTSKLHVYNGDITIQTDNNSESQGVLFQNSGGNYVWRMYRSDAGSNNANFIIAGGNNRMSYDNLTTRLKLFANGDVCIGNCN